MATEPYFVVQAPPDTTPRSIPLPEEILKARNVYIYNQNADDIFQEVFRQMDQ